MRMNNAHTCCCFLFLYMSNIHFLFNKTKELNSKQQWRDLIQRALQNQIDFSHTKYSIVEDERFDRISKQSILCLPTKGITNSKMTKMQSIVHHIDFERHSANLLIIPWLRQKRVTSKLFRVIFVFDFEYLVVPMEQRATLDDIHQIMNKTFSKHSTHDDRIRRQSLNSIVDIQQTQNLSRLSVLSISYGFGLGTKTWKNIREEKTLHSITSISSLPANKTELVKRVPL